MAKLGVLPGQLGSPALDMSGSFTFPDPYRPAGGCWREVAAAIPEAQFVDVYDILMRQWIVKDRLESGLTQRTMDHFSGIHAFVRNHILERGTDTVDWEVANADTLGNAANHERRPADRETP